MEIVVYGFHQVAPEVSEDFEFIAELSSQKWVKLPDGHQILGIIEGTVEGYCLKNAEKLLDIYSEEAEVILKEIGAWSPKEEEEEPAVMAGDPWPEELVEPAKERGYSGLARPMMHRARYDPKIEVRANNILVFNQDDLEQFARWNVKFEKHGIDGQQIWPTVGLWENMVGKGKMFRITECPPARRRKR